MRGSSKVVVGRGGHRRVARRRRRGRGARASPSRAYTPMTRAEHSDRARCSSQSPISVPNAAQLRLGQYLVRVGDCASCHTRDGGAFLSGGFALNTPFGKIYSTNLTSDPETGIGAFTPRDLLRRVARRHRLGRAAALSGDALSVHDARHARRLATRCWPS